MAWGRGPSKAYVSGRLRTPRTYDVALAAVVCKALVVAKATSLVERIRKICLALPEVTERPSHGAPTFFVRGKSTFVTVWAEGHHDHTFPHLWCAAPQGAQELRMAEDPARIFRPPYVGHRGWIGVRLDAKIDWAQIEELCEDAYRTVAPKTLIARLDADH